MNTKTVMAHLDQNELAEVVNHFQPPIRDPENPPGGLVSDRVDDLAERKTEFWDQLFSVGLLGLVVALGAFHEEIRNPAGWLSSEIKFTLMDHLAEDFLSGHPDRKRRVSQAHEMQFNFTNEEIARALKVTPRTVEKYLAEPVAQREPEWANDPITEHNWEEYGDSVLDLWPVLHKMAKTPKEQLVLEAAWDHGDSLKFGPLAWAEISCVTNLSIPEIGRTLTRLLNRYYMVTHGSRPGWKPISGDRVKQRVA